MTPSPAPITPSQQSDLAALDQSARLTLRLVENLNLAALRFGERQRLSRILHRLETVTGEVQSLLIDMGSNL